LTESRDRLEQITGEPAIHLSCPGGRCDSAVARAAREAGYESVATSRIGLNAGHADRWSLNRIAIHRGTTLPQFAAACRGRIAARQFTQRTLDAAKRVLGNGAYVTLRDGLLGRRA
jgi:peptidoglycan/xylan/chitin deacetylase (PgdA/CDA1 family)